MKKIKFDKLTISERSLLLFIAQTGAVHLEEMQMSVFGDLGTGTSPARNTLRKLVKNDLVCWVEKGTYNVTQLGLSVVPSELLEEVATPRQRVARGSTTPTSGLADVTDDQLEAVLTLALSAVQERKRRQTLAGELPTPTPAPTHFDLEDLKIRR